MMNKHPKIQDAAWKGYILVALAAMFWALAGTLAKYMMIRDIPRVVLAEMRVPA